MTTQDAHKKVRDGTRLAATLALVAVLGGCALQPAQQAHDAGSVLGGGKPVDANLNGFLAQSRGGAAIQLAKSPWGRDVEVLAETPYFAASGRPCRELSIRRPGRQAEQGAIACETASGNWVVRRQVTQAVSQGGRR
ncbi:DVU3141 family protein [Halomonas lysinitropha]|uniref:Uncharacterized protein n=1 Tax=Halomonas lysinitropha TaxID=2607506 RepID=A0A5K1I8W9_9GAMM|nr:DVU3141 family protein [Halomonas lysinitropha]VVZ95512.1 hypothetical protein HALO32_01583 [Halomonas lysinitropha]